MNTWMNYINELKNENVIIFLIGTKSDLDNIIITKCRINDFMLKHNIKKYFETSSLESININNIFIELSYILIDKTKNQKYINFNIEKN